MDSNNAIKSLNKVVNFFKSNGVKCWLTDGTLLGCIRNNGFIGHDPDIDLGIRIEDVSYKLIRDIREKFNIKHVLGFLEDGLEITIIVDGIPIDLFFFYKDGNRFYHCAYYLGTLNGINNRQIRYYYNNLDLIKHNFLGLEVLIPKNNIEYIKSKYGESWNIPDTSWNNMLDPKNKVITNNTTVLRGLV